jgi:hypothetical protein
VRKKPPFQAAARVRSGSKANLKPEMFDVRSSPDTGHGPVSRERLLCANSGLMKRNKESFDHLVGTTEERHRDGQTECLRCLEVDDQLDFCGLLDW